MISQEYDESLLTLLARREVGQCPTHRFAKGICFRHEPVARRYSIQRNDEEHIQVPIRMGSSSSSTRTAIANRSIVTTMDHDPTRQSRYLLVGTNHGDIAVYDLCDYDLLWHDDDDDDNHNSNYHHHHYRRDITKRTATTITTKGWHQPIQQTTATAAPLQGMSTPVISSSSPSPLVSIRWYPLDTGMFFTATRRGVVQIWDTNTMQSVWDCQPFQFETDRAAATTTTTTTAASTSSTLGQQSLLAKLDINQPGGSLLAVAAGRCPHLKLLDPRTGTFSQTLYGHTGRGVYDIQWSPICPYLLASTGTDSTIRIWDIRKPQHRSGTGWGQHRRPYGNNVLILDGNRTPLSHKRSGISLGYDVWPCILMDQANLQRRRRRQSRNHHQQQQEQKNKQPQVALDDKTTINIRQKLSSRASRYDISNGDDDSATRQSHIHSLSPASSRIPTCGNIRLTSPSSSKLSRDGESVSGITPLSHSSPCLRIAWDAPHGNHLISASADGDIQVWDLLHQSSTTDKDDGCGCRLPRRYISPNGSKPISPITSTNASTTTGTVPHSTILVSARPPPSWGRYCSWGERFFWTNKGSHLYGYFLQRDGGPPSYVLRGQLGTLTALQYVRGDSGEFITASTDGVLLWWKPSKMTNATGRNDDDSFTRNVGHLICESHQNQPNSHSQQRNSKRRRESYADQDNW